MSELKKKLRKGIDTELYLTASGSTRTKDNENFVLTIDQAKEILSLYDKVEQLEKQDYKKLKGIMKKLDELDKLQQQNERLRRYALKAVNANKTDRDLHILNLKETLKNLE